MNKFFIFSIILIVSGMGIHAETYTFHCTRGYAAVDTDGPYMQKMVINFMADNTHVWCRVLWPNANTTIRVGHVRYRIPANIARYYAMYGVRPDRNLHLNMTQHKNTWFGGFDYGRKPRVGVAFLVEVPITRIARAFVFIQESRLITYNVFDNVCTDFVLRFSEKILGKIRTKGSLWEPKNAQQWFGNMAHHRDSKYLKVYSDVRIIKKVLLTPYGADGKIELSNEIIGSAEWAGGWSAGNSSGSY